MQYQRYFQHHLETVDSTQDYAARELEIIDPHSLYLITATSQTKGRGQKNRTWVSPKCGNLYATFVFLFPQNRKDLNNLSQVFSVSAAQSLASLGFKIQLKWPNDLMLDGKKVGGVLCTLHPQGAYYYKVLLGFGLNVNLDPLEIQEQVDRKLTSLKANSEGEVLLDELRDKITRDWLENLNFFLEQGFPPFYTSFTQRMLYLNCNISFIRGEQEEQGVITGLSKNGGLQLKDANGVEKTYFSGEISKLQPL